MATHASRTELNQQLDRWLRRYRLQRAVCWSLRGAVSALVITLPIALVAVFRGALLQSEFVAMVIIVTLSGWLVAALTGYVWRLDRLAAARRFDRHFKLSERMSTALELSRSDQSTSELGQRQLQDTLLAARRVKVDQQLPLKIKRADALLGAVLLAATLFVVWRGDAFFQAAAQTRAAQQTISQAAAQIEALSQQVAADPSLTEAQRREMLDALKETQQQLKDAQSLEQATSVLTRGEKKFESLTSSPAEAQAQALRDAGRNLAQNENSPLQNFGQNLAEGNFLAAAQDLRNIDTGQLSSAEVAALAKQLEDAAEALQAGNPELARQLREAAAAARQGDTQKAQQSLEQAAQAMTQTAQQAASSNVARQAATQIGQGRQRMIAAGRSAQAQTAQGNPSSGGNQSAQGNQAGQGNQTGQGTGQGASSAQGNSSGSGSGAGRGTGSGSNRAGPEAGSKPIGQNNGPGDGGETTYEPIYASQRLGGNEGDTVTLPGSSDPNGDVIGQSGVAPGNDQPSQVPYTQVLAQYVNAYQQAIDSGQVPPQLRDMIRQYFSSLQP